MTTSIVDSWVVLALEWSWAGDWVFHGDHGERVGGLWFIIEKPDNDNEENHGT